jgi:hypothetical protein
MQRQVFSADSQGRPTWQYIDLGPAKVADVRGSSIVPRESQRHALSDNFGRKRGHGVQA